MRWPAAACASAIMALTLTACGDAQDELQQWIEQQRREVKPNVTPLSPPKKFNPQAYLAGAGVEPFSTQKLTVAIKQESRQPNSLLAAEINRRKEPLEAYPLEGLSMVGTLEKGKTRYALVKTPERDIYQVRQGNHMGQNFGVVVGISDTDIKLKELMQDGAGDWSERSSTLNLLQADQKQEQKK
jgi:type IV pilus assembly protein PilP